MTVPAKRSRKQLPFERHPGRAEQPPLSGQKLLLSGQKRRWGCAEAPIRGLFRTGLVLDPVRVRVNSGPGWSRFRSGLLPILVRVDGSSPTKSPRGVLISRT